MGARDVIVKYLGEDAARAIERFVACCSATRVRHLSAVQDAGSCQPGM